MKIKNENDTIAAVATGIGGAGIGIIRLSGDAAVKIGDGVFRHRSGKTLKEAETHKLLYGEVIDPSSGKVIDEALVSKMKGPFSYTAEDVVEINCHGGIVPLQKILKAVLSIGARLAEPGEFTKRAFLNGRLDLTQAEAVMDIISAKTEEGLQFSVDQLEGSLSKVIEAMDDELLDILSYIEANIDYPEYETVDVTAAYLKEKITGLSQSTRGLLKTANAGKIYREGITTVILGEPNVGKSSLLNTLLRENRAIVTEIPGTTRDVIEETLNIKGIPFKLVDTAGIRETDNLVEKIGVDISRKKIETADLVLFIHDISREISEEEKDLMALLENKKTIYIANKIDMDPRFILKKPWIGTSFINEVGVDTLKEAMVKMVMEGEIVKEANYILTNTRHIGLLEDFLVALQAADFAIGAGFPLEMISIDLQDALGYLREILGKTVDSEIIHRIFKNFCIGK